MARGWESKEIESQMLAAESSPNRGADKRLTPDERALMARRNHLNLNHTRVQEELQRCVNSRFRVQLESELAFLSAELAKLDN
jgi:hypothetical protein